MAVAAAAESAAHAVRQRMRKVNRMDAHIKVWLEQDGRLALSDYRARLLRLVQDTGSLAQAAQALGLSYRRAWGKVRELERNLGCELVTSDVGGVGGGRSRLTPAGERLLVRYEAFLAALADETEALFRRHFPESEATIGERAAH